ncbi:hypothetical protein [uncultured Hydrogenophaga sp.]|uniref:hypothetical protein n=1 Tax=uncultured Hydrogenophaga sp. TaxID=199683 RepID=UPI00265DDEF4|nr:hypothetical protein [uncultured Hydrogenophaga sp.]
MSHSPTLPPFPIDLCDPPPDESAGEGVLRCVQSRLARPPAVQLDPQPTALNRQMQKACAELQVLIGTSRRLALQQANRELIHQTMPGEQSLQRLQAARSAWRRQWSELMDRLNALQDGLPTAEEVPMEERDQHTVTEAHRLIESIRHWALGFCTDVDLELDGSAVQGTGDTPAGAAAGSTRVCQ